MAFDLEALVGHLYLVGGRSISTPPPGALVEVAPRQAARGRELDTFFTLVLPSGDITAPTTFYQQMAQMAAERFFSQSGSITSALRNVFNTINHNLFEHNDSGRSHYEAHMICAVLHAGDLYVGRVGAAVAVLRYNARTITFPEDLKDDEQVFRPPLGVQPMPDVRYTRYQVNNGTRLLLGDDHLAEVELDQITNSLISQDLEQVIEECRTLIKDYTSLMAVQFVPPDETIAVPAATGESTTEIALEIAAARAQARATQEAPAIEQPNRPSTTKVLRSHSRRWLGNIVGFLGGILHILNRILDIIFPQPDESSGKRVSPAITSAVVVFVPLAIVIIVILSWAGGIGSTRFEQCMEQTNTAVDLANSIVSSDPQGTVSAWQAVLLIIEECEEQRPNDPELARLKVQGQQIVDTLNSVKRREGIPLATIPNATISDIVLQGQELYVLDGANERVYRITLGADKRSANRPEPIANMRSGVTVDGLLLGDIINIAFNDVEKVIVAVDINGVVVTCKPQFIDECEAQRLETSEDWNNPTEITIWEGRLYVMDIGLNQIWRYEPAGGQYPSRPRDYFAAGRPDLSNAVDFGISGRQIYVLTSDGIIQKFLSGQAEGFEFSGFPAGQELRNTISNGMFLNDSPIAPAFYIFSREARTIYETTQAGTFITTYRVFDEDQLALLSDIAVDAGNEFIYIASGNAIFSIAKAE